MNRTNKTIRDVASFLKWVKENHTITSVADKGTELSWFQSSIYYRGQANSTWELKPSVFRHNDVQEHELLHKAELMLWDKVASCKTYLEKLIYFQHYGLPTRLLDVTFNPLIALYMACDEEKERDSQGVVYVGYKESGNKYAMEVTELTAKFVFNYSFRNFENDLKTFVDAEKSKMEYFTHTTLIMPPINNPRIEVQNGAFIMSPLITDAKYLVPNKGNLNNSGFFDERKFLIPSTCKEDILKELSELGINRGSIYRDTEKKLQSLLQDEKWRCNGMIDAETIREQERKT